MKQSHIKVLTMLLLSSYLLVGGYVANKPIPTQVHKKDNYIVVKKTHSDSLIEKANEDYLKRCSCNGFLENNSISRKDRSLKLNIDNTFLAEANFSYLYGDSLQKKRVVNDLYNLSKCPKQVIVSLFWDSIGYHSIRDPIDGKPVLRNASIPIDYE